MARPEITGQKTGDTDSTTIFDLAGELMPDSMFAKSFNVSTKTIDRWDHNPKLEFPEVVWINGR